MFMEHKKADHMQAVPKCNKFLKGKCSLKSEQCWYSHNEINETFETKNIQTNSVFQKGQEQSHPPDMILRLFSMMEKIIAKVDSLEKMSMES